MFKRTALIVLLITAFLSALYTPKKIARALSSNEYLRVITTDTPIYLDQLGTQLLFYLPYTYYVKVLSIGETFAHVEYLGDDGTLAIDGYVPFDMLYKDDLSVANPYPRLTLTTCAPCVLYADPSLSSPVCYLFENRNLTFLGNYVNENTKTTLYYVCFNGRLGYVEETGLFPFTLENHPNPLTFIPEEEPIIPEAEPSENLTTLRITIIACLLSAGLITLALALRKNVKPVKQTYYYDENDYE